MSKTCTICGKPLSANALSGPAHGRKHRNEFERKVGREPEDYNEVRAFFSGELTIGYPTEQAQLGCFA
ncbi:hypothetical protein [Halococcus hamelinensis]|uniref:Uncharacterized protein n=1 Tax=Halococcus hamelinensis 100A6 TaxID=1132509 RepID=M0M1I5_9EURY|nr:hypothetical protein [Halococcus hamelinensis]EMA38454.1 hypothetical protein C447_09877 [Halococcus hamelinensis 100A6]